MARTEVRALDEAERHSSSKVSAADIQGLHVSMSRKIERAKPCHDNIAIIAPGRGPHAAELKCAVCNAHRGWLAKSTYDFLSETVRLFGVPAEPFTIRDTAATEQEAQMHIDTLYPNKWLKAADLCGKSITVTIKSVTIEEVGVDREKRPVCSFVGKDKKLILNKTNTRAIADLYGAETDKWPSKKIVVYPTETQYGDKEMAAIRIKPPKDYVRPEASDEEEETEAKPHDDMDDEIPF